MKLINILNAVAVARQINVSEIQRNIFGNFLEQFERGYNYGDSNSLHGLATMAAFLQAPESRTTSIEAFEFSINDFIEKFTNYGCYCWILGADKGVIGGGQTRDQIDGLCGQLYKCYKCLNLDFGTSSTIFDYDVSLVAHDNGDRELVCHDGNNKDACLCDKSFAESLASITKQCSQDELDGNQNSPFCINEDFRTQNGGGNFDPLDESEDGCFKNGMEHHRKDLCCGEYPDRLPYDSMNRECCRMTTFEHSSAFDMLVSWGTCEERGGVVVENGNEL